MNKSLSKWLILVTKTNDLQGLKNSCVNRRINREKFELNQLKDELSNNKRRQGVFNGLRNMISIRKESTAFSPFADQKVVDCNCQPQMCTFCQITLCTFYSKIVSRCFIR